MAASLSFFPTVRSVVQSSLRLIRGMDPEQSINGTTQETQAIEVLNFLLTSWQTHGLQVWLRSEQGPVTLVAAQHSYTVGSGGNINIDRPLEIYQAWIRDDNADVDIPLTQLSENEYNLIGNKDIDSIPNSYMYLPEYKENTNAGATSKGKLWLWPAADTATAADKTLYFRYTRPLLTSTTATDGLDLPQEWMNAVRWNLAYQLALEYGVPSIEVDRLNQRAMYELEQVLGWDSEKTSIRIYPDPKVLR